jgi:hypothetical protein
MIKRLMESFDTDAAKLAGYSKFVAETMEVHTSFGDVNKQLVGIEVKLGINQCWEAYLKGDGNRVDAVGHREAFAQTLCNQVDDIDDADRSGPSHQTDFPCLTGNSKNNSDATIHQHMLQAKSIRNIDLDDKNYVLENDLLDTQEQRTAILAQNLLVWCTPRWIKNS